MVTDLELSNLLCFLVISGIQCFCSEYLLQNHTHKKIPGYNGRHVMLIYKQISSVHIKEEKEIMQPTVDHLPRNSLVLHNICTGHSLKLLCN